jgi:hypothetical protein
LPVGSVLSFFSWPQLPGGRALPIGALPAAEAEAEAAAVAAEAAAAEAAADQSVPDPVGLSGNEMPVPGSEILGPVVETTTVDVVAHPISADDGPVLGLPFAVRGRRPPWWAVVVIALVTGGIAAAISSPLVGLAAGVAVAVALLVPQVRAVTAVVAVGLLLAAGVTVVAGQVLHPVPESSDWASAYDRAGVLVWMAVVFLGADAVVETARSMVRRRGSAPPPGPPPAGAGGADHPPATSP